jgi:Protein of unknown function (DUF742)
VGADEGTFADVLNAFSLGSRRKRPPEPAGDIPVAVQPVPRQAVGEDYEDNASIVRAYAWTGGRTRHDFRLRVETLISTAVRGLDQLTSLTNEHQEVVELCVHSRSVAEVGAILGLPLGVVRVLLGDMAGLGLITVHENDSGPDLALLERVLRGLTNLRS